MRILAFSHAGHPSGFGVAAHHLYRRWVEAGHQVHVLAAHCPKEPPPLPYTLHPTRLDASEEVYGTQLAGPLIARLDPHVLFFLYDLPVAGLYLDRIATQGELRPWLERTVLYAPLDYVNLPPHWFRPVATVRRTVMQSRWAAQTIRREGGLDADWAWLGVDRGLFHPATSSDPVRLKDAAGRKLALSSKEEAKRLLDLEGRFLVLAVSANHGRKNLADTIKVFAAFAADKPDALLFLHANPVANGIDLLAVVSRLGIRAKVRFPNDYGLVEDWPPSHLAALYNAADVYLSTSCGEGFGLSLAEALACALPIVAQDFSAMPEVIGDGGILTPPERLRTCGNGADLSLPRLEPMVEALERLYHSLELRLELSGKAVRQARAFSWDVSASRILAALQEAAGP